MSVQEQTSAPPQLVRHISANDSTGARCCAKCKKEKSLEDFAWENKAKNKKRYRCKACDKIVHGEYLERLGPEGREKRKAKQRERRNQRPEIDREYQAKYRQKHPARGLIRHAKRRAREKGLPFDLIEQEITDQIWKGCELTGMPFDLSPGRKWNSPSIDQIQPKKGYTKENTRVILYGLNCALGEWGVDVLKMVVAAVK